MSNEEDKYVIDWGMGDFVGATIKKPTKEQLYLDSMTPFKSIKSFEECKHELIKELDEDIDALNWQKTRIQNMKREDTDAQK